MKEQDLYWLAGLLEGEGYFAYSSTAHISLQMTDKDVVAKAAFLMNVSVIVRTEGRKSTYKPTYRIRVNGQPAVDLMKQLLPLMGIRRQEKITQVIERYENRTNTWSNKPKLNEAMLDIVRNLDAQGIGPTQIAKRLSEIANKEISKYNISDALRGALAKLPPINVDLSEPLMRNINKK